MNFTPDTGHKRSKRPRFGWEATVEVWAKTGPDCKPTATLHLAGWAWHRDQALSAAGFDHVACFEDRPVVRDGQIVIRPMMYLALSYDHRLIDGREAVTALKIMKEAIEDPTRLLIDL